MGPGRRAGSGCSSSRGGARSDEHFRLSHGLCEVEYMYKNVYSQDYNQ